MSPLIFFIIDSASIGILLAGYIILSTWATLDLKVRQQGAYSYMGCIRRMLTGLALIALALGCMEWLGQGIFPYPIIFCPPILGVQILWLVLECLFERLEISRIPQLAIRGGLIACTVILLFLADGNNYLQQYTSGVISLYVIIPALGFITFFYGVWVIIWPAVNMLAGGIRLMLRRTP